MSLALAHVVKWRTRPRRLQDVRGGKPDDRGRNRRNRRKEYGAVSPSGVSAETGYRTCVRKGATV